MPDAYFTFPTDSSISRKPSKGCKIHSGSQNRLRIQSVQSGYWAPLPTVCNLPMMAEESVTVKSEQAMLPTGI